MKKPTQALGEPCHCLRCMLPLPVWAESGEVRRDTVPESHHVTIMHTKAESLYLVTHTVISIL